MFIRDYYREIHSRITQNILTESDSYLLSVNSEQLAQYYYDLYSLPIIEKDESREIQSEYEPSLRRTRGGMIIGRDLVITLDYPIIISDRINEVLDREASRGYMGRVYSLKYRRGWIKTQVQISADGKGQERRIQAEVETVENMINWKNKDVMEGNKSLKPSITQFIEQQKERIIKDDALVDSLLEKIPIKISRKTGTRAEPIDIRIRKSIEPIYPSVERPSEPILESDKINAIIELIVNAGKGFEITPQVFNLLEEEHLRDIILGFLNTIFTLAATGESFVKKGKTDIHINFDKGSILSAECKKWDGSALYAKTIDQLFDYLVWRQNHGIIITFSERKGFSGVIERAKQTTLEHTTIIEKATIDLDASYFITNHRFPEDPQKTVTIHHILFNLFFQNG